MRKLLNEMMKVNEEDIDMIDGQTDPVEITPELMANLVEQMPELADIDQSELEKGIKVEMEHYDTVGGDMLLVAKIAVDHIKETPEGKSYYDALESMEHELQESPEEEAEEHMPDGEEIETPVDDLPMESKTARGKRDGTGPYKDSAMAGEKGKRKQSGEKCPAEVKESVEEEKQEVETATNEEAQKMVDSGEAEIPNEAIVTEEEAKKE